MGVSCGGSFAVWSNLQIWREQLQVEVFPLVPAILREGKSKWGQAVRSAVRRAFNASHGKKPQTEVHLIRLPTLV